MALDIKYVSPNGGEDAQGTFQDPWRYGGQQMLGAAPGTLLLLLPGTYSQSAPLVFTNTSPPTGDALIVMAGCSGGETSIPAGQLLHPARTGPGGTGPLDTAAMPRIVLDPDTAFMDSVPKFFVFYGLYITGDHNAPLLGVGTDDGRILIEGCAIVNRSEDSGAGAAATGAHSNVGNCDLSLSGSGSADCLDAGSGTGVAACRLAGGKVGVLCGSSNALFRCLLRGHAAFGAIFPETRMGAWLVNLTAHEVGRFFRYAGEGERVAGGASALNCHVTDCDYLASSISEPGEPVGFFARSVRIHGQTALYDNIEATEFNTIDTAAPPTGGDYVNPGEGDYRLRNVAVGIHASRLSRLDLGAFRNEDDE